MAVIQRAADPEADSAAVVVHSGSEKTGVHLLSDADERTGTATIASSVLNLANVRATK